MTPEQKADNRELARQRIMAENVIGRLKVFRILSERYRNRRKRFGLRFNLIAAIYNFEFVLNADLCKRSITFFERLHENKKFISDPINGFSIIRLQANRG